VNTKYRTVMKIILLFNEISSIQLNHL